MNRKLHHALATLACLVALACGDDDAGDRTSTPPADLGTAVDMTTPTPGVDSGTPMPGVDSGTPTPGVDMGTTPAVDMGGGGSSSDRDPRLVSDEGAGQIGCGDVSCSSPQVCCTSFDLTTFDYSQVCGAEAACSGFGSSPGHCDGPEDCSGGQVCCVDMGGAVCADSCTGGQSELCHTDDSCSEAGADCRTCEAPTMGLVEGLYYGLCTTSGSCPSPYNEAP